MNSKNKNINFLNYSYFNSKISAKKLIIKAKKSKVFKNIYLCNKDDLDESFKKNFVKL